MALFMVGRSWRNLRAVFSCPAVMTLPRKENATAGDLAQSKKRHRVKPSGAVAKDAGLLRILGQSDQEELRATPSRYFFDL